LASGSEKASGADAATGTPTAADAAAAAATTTPSDETATDGLEMQNLQNSGSQRDMDYNPKHDDDQFGFQGDEVGLRVRVRVSV
jgi:hypothetical protein